MPRFIDPVHDLGGLLLEVEKPGRYVGGEYGRLASKNTELRTLIAFPDLYEIGMSNQALRILYTHLNRIAGVSCDRAFAPAPDFEKLLRERNLPLYGLDTGISLSDLDLLLFTLGYELGSGGVLTMLDISGIPLHCAERNDEHPIVIAGGPVVSNPLPYTSFIDAFWIGEAEAGFFDLVGELLKLKKREEGRAALLAKIRSHPNIWVKGKDRAFRAVDADFGGKAAAAVFPVASMKTIQQHGAVEIMRGCPNGCRFCHAGFWYRPMRQKKQDIVIEEAAAFINQGGYREISLSSLSSGDYTGIGDMVDALNRQFGDQHISFQMPSLKVSGFSLSLLEKISKTRKSGLTFAVESPVDTWQMAINKEVPYNSVVEILMEAKKRGWRGAKFYFMIGLPPSLPQGHGGGACTNDSPHISGPEEVEIVDFIVGVGRRTGMHFNINIGIFVPKPHTPYQWAAQLNSEAAAAKLDFIKYRLKPLGHKVSVSDPLISLIEGLLSRGDERIGPLIEEAYQGGSRLDGWHEYINKEKWLTILEKNQDLVTEILSAKKPETPPPWQVIKSGVSPDYVRQESRKSENREFTLSCTKKCAERCGVCDDNAGVVYNSIQDKHVSRDIPVFNKKSLVPVETNKPDNSIRHKTDTSIWRVLFSFSKEGSAVFHGHLSLIEIFSMAFTRARLPTMYSQGFNPLARLEILAPLSTGVSADAEIAAVDFASYEPLEGFAEQLNRKLPDGIHIKKAESYFIPGGAKKHSLSSLLWGFTYTGEKNEMEYVKAVEEKQYRQKRLDKGFTLFSFRRNSVLAKNIIGIPDTATDSDITPWASYFTVYNFLYPPKTH
jgi:radical SAM superfamily enzyme YgiQ (UPF0313 family)/uncharacterized protein (DUF2344 family)